MSDHLTPNSSKSKKISQAQGVVVGNKMMKTVVVEIQRRVLHPLYHKVVSRRTRIKAHTQEPIEVGSVVEIISTRPISKDKSHRVLRVISTPKIVN
ncbi:MULTISPECIES: 30S ribosomal protein S17 [Leptospirillum]|jgi:small subunit ribosomal protein S17|uniref:30S ribosomal protein S17 n=1 Tax=Leptospirillum TaxID=179 RepID=UPI0000F0CEAB|nr:MULTISPECIES: 30S ribosomal protein S17 [Leptospirillum]AKS23274.1 30S ribosomal protein S17 [Leptospirillum sp. Group II 'CF-1']EAY55947.1 MAG: ribosomal protein S17 [Leptospirillum rubarum]EIJ76303.1 MAG: Ribosomal protein S17 [Leptospirillum sp. Group II 'C75']